MVTFWVSRLCERVENRQLDLLDANAVPRAAAEGYIEFIDVVKVRVTLEPALRTELERFVEDVRVVQYVSQRHGNRVAGRYDEFFVLESLIRCHERQARSEEGADAKGLTDDGRLSCRVREVLQSASFLRQNSEMRSNSKWKLQ